MKKNIDVSRSELETAIDEWIFSERNRKVLKRRLLDGICLQDLAEEFDLSITRIKNIIHDGQECVYSHIKQNNAS